ncbi:MAG: AarF/UbiB family protein [Chloroflexaceae bacterium]|nr:AarF/UbiB family protein [Chloroflexaceae bacterium]
MQTAIETTTSPSALQRATAAPSFNARKRFLRVSLFFLRVVIHIYFWDIFLVRYSAFRWYARRSALGRWVKIARRFRFMALELGGTQIKLGQFLSSRADIVPDAVRHELAGLQDEVPAAPSSHVLAVIMEELGATPHELFETFDSKAVAAASLGQVHYATLPNGEEVAVKVQRPHIEDIIEVDLSALGWVIRLIKNYPPIRRRADLEALLDEFAKVLREELDYVQEARNAEIFRTNFADDPGVYTPMPVREMTTRRVLVMERINGVKITDLKKLDELGVSRHELAERVNTSYLKQFFVHGFFHADPHPGNLFVQLEPQLPVVRANGHAPAEALTWPTIAEAAPYVNGNGHHAANGTLPHAEEPEAIPAAGRPFKLIFVDFGMVGRLPPQTMEIVRGGVLGLATNDAERIVESLAQLNMILPGADRRPIVQAIEILLRYSYNRTMRELSNMDVEEIFSETHAIIYDLPFQIPQDLLYLGRALSMVGGLATAIEPDINLFESLRPFARQMMDRERQQGDWASRMQHELQEIGKILLTLPRQMDSYYRAANRGELHTRSDYSKLERELRRVERSNERLTAGIVAVGLFLGGVQLRSQGLEKEAQRAWLAAAATVGWSFWPRSDR